MRALVLLLTLTGCTTVVYVNPDSGSSDGAGSGDMTSEPVIDFSGVDVAGYDFAKTPQPDMTRVPDLAGVDLYMCAPLGTVCGPGTQTHCCSVMCNYQGAATKPTCCYANGVNCQNSQQCCGLLCNAKGTCGP